MKRETRAWVRKAEADWGVAVREAATVDPARDVVCFLCQQCAEKYLKALLHEIGLPAPKIHDLDQLLSDLLPHQGSLKRLRSRLVILSRYAVDYRYPGFSATVREMRAALRHAARIRLAARMILALPP
jgi:HEPN domain-containing protein